MALSSARLIDVIEVRDQLREGVVWRESDNTVWWVDILGRRIHCLAWPGLDLKTYATPERPSALAFIAGRDDVMVVSFESGFALWRPETGAIHWLARPESLGEGVRLNDGRVDPDGRFWVGAMSERSVPKGSLAPGALFRLAASGEAIPVLAGLHIANGICWSPDGRRMYLADSARGEVYVAAFDPAHGSPARFELFARFKGEAPDGAVTDAAGNYWTALWGGARVGVLSPEGQEIASIAIDAPQPSCPAFGGPDGNLLFVTSAQQGMTAEALAASPRSGNLFVFETEARGAPAARVVLSKTVLAGIAG
jgi:sugar lactone lactonase YvrE